MKLFNCCRTEKTQMGEIARRLGMSKRTLARQLSSEG
jgi:ActR/RegA family two-component response regulator